MPAPPAVSLPLSPLWTRVLSTDYPMVALYKALSTSDQRRRDLALEIVRSPEQVAYAFAKTIAAVGPYASTYPFHERGRGRGPEVNPAAIRATKDVGLRLGPPGTQTRVDTRLIDGLSPGALDVVFLDREVSLTRTTKAHRTEGIEEPKAKLQADLLLAAPDGTIGIGEIKIGRDRDLFYALIQALAGVALVATPSQIGRILRNYPMPRTALAPGPAPKLDAVLVSVPRDAPDTYLTQLDVLARGFAPELLAQPAIGGVVRRIVGLQAALAGEQLQLTAKWVERSR